MIVTSKPDLRLAAWLARPAQLQQLDSFGGAFGVWGFLARGIQVQA